jgi:hypothetical protein
MNSKPFTRENLFFHSEFHSQCVIAEMSSERRKNTVPPIAVLMVTPALLCTRPALY